MYILYILNKKEKDDPNYDLLVYQRRKISGLFGAKKEYERQVQLLKSKINKIEKVYIPRNQRDIEFAQAELRLLEKAEKK